MRTGSSMAEVDPPAIDWSRPYAEDAPPHTRWRPAATAWIERTTEAIRVWLDRRPWAAGLALAVLAILLATLIVLLATMPRREEAAHHRAVVAAHLSAPSPDQPPPTVDPVELLKVDPATAREMNAKVAFSTDPNIAARPFRTALAGDDLLRAVDCLAAAAWYEAGNDPPGEAAVAQVVLNRVRHPAYPHTVCGVVFQGSERSTGCQFTFSCDGALARIPGAKAWSQAQAIAVSALSGAVYRDVGLATHYHTDWVVPYWRDTLDKITALHTHLFYRWRGWWGTPQAFSIESATIEPRIAKLAFLSDVHKDPAALSELRLAAAVEALHVRREGNSVLLELPAAMGADDFPAMAAALCARRDHCRVIGWSDARHIPVGLPDAAAVAGAGFVYTRDTAANAVSKWDCDRYARVTPADCMARPAIAPPPPLAEDAAPPAAVAQPQPSQADGAAEPKPAAPPKKRRIDPCRAFRNVDDRIGFCSNR